MRARHWASIVAVGFLLAYAPAPAGAQQQGFLEPIKEAAVMVWDFLRSPFQRETVSAVTANSPVDVMHGLRGGSDFWDHIRDAGYELAEVTTSIGIIPDVKMSFRLVRELSDADREMLELKLEIDAMRSSGITSLIQRQIVHTLLDASNIEDMRITKLDIVLLPLPAAEFVMEPRELPLGEEHDAIIRAVQNRSTTMQKGMEDAMAGSKKPGRQKGPIKESLD